MNSSELYCIQREMIYCKRIAFLFAIMILETTNKLLGGFESPSNFFVVPRDILGDSKDTSEILKCFDNVNDSQFIHAIRGTTLEARKNVKKVSDWVKKWDASARLYLNIYAIRYTFDMSDSTVNRFNERIWPMFYRSFSRLYEENLSQKEKDQLWENLLSLVDLSRVNKLNENSDSFNEWINRSRSDFLGISQNTITFLTENELYLAHVPILDNNAEDLRKVVRSDLSGSPDETTIALRKVNGLLKLISVFLQEEMGKTSTSIPESLKYVKMYDGIKLTFMAGGGIVVAALVIIYLFSKFI